MAYIVIYMMFLQRYPVILHANFKCALYTNK